MEFYASLKLQKHILYFTSICYCLLHNILPAKLSGLMQRVFIISQFLCQKFRSRWVSREYRSPSFTLSTEEANVQRAIPEMNKSTMLSIRH